MAGQTRRWGIASSSYIQPDSGFGLNNNNNIVTMEANIVETPLLNAVDEDVVPTKVDALDLSSSSSSNSGGSGRRMSNLQSQPARSNRLPPNSQMRTSTVQSGGIGSSSADKSFQPSLPPLEAVTAPPVMAAKPSATAGPSAAHSDDSHRCDICGKTFAVPARLTRHYRTHTGERPFVCEVCGKSFSVKENLSVHRRIHTKEKPYRCTHCGRGFEHSGKLHRHMRIHTGERPHQCTACGKTFIQSGQLVIHMRSHTGEKPYVCTVCKKGFTCSKQLKVHSRTHTGERPYACDTCGKTFAYNHVLKLHMMAHLGERLYKCTICSETHTSKKALETHIKSHGSAANRQSMAAASTSSLTGNASTSAAGAGEGTSMVGGLSYKPPSPLTPAVPVNAPPVAGTKGTAMNLRQRQAMLGRNVSSGGSCVIDQHQNQSQLQQRQQQQQAEQSRFPAMGVDFNMQSPLSSGESSRSSPSDLDVPGPSSPISFSNHAGSLSQQQQPPQLTYFPQSASASTVGLAWNIQEALGRQRPPSENYQQQLHGNICDSTEIDSNFAYPQLLSSTRHCSTNKRHPEQFNKNRHLLGSQSPLQKHGASQLQTQQLDLHSEIPTPMTYLRPMPPLIPVTASTLARSGQQQQQLNDLQSLPPVVVDSSLNNSRGPPRKSFRFRDGGCGRTGGCDVSSSESSDHSPASSTSPSPPLVEQNNLLPTPNAAADQAHRSTSVIQFAHRPSSNNSSPSPSSPAPSTHE